MIPKYRCWDKGNKVMREVMMINYYDNRGGVTIRCNGLGHKNKEWFNPDFYLEEIELMQSTGKSDIKGNEIWQKSIVKVENHPFQKDKNGFGIEINGNYLVEWNEKDLTWCAGNLLLSKLLPYVTVIGDYYRNPELLEV